MAHYAGEAEVLSATGDPLERVRVVLKQTAPLQGSVFPAVNGHMYPTACNGFGDSFGDVVSVTLRLADGRGGRTHVTTRHIGPPPQSAGVQGSGWRPQ